MYYSIFYQQLIYKTFNSRNSLWYIEYQTISKTNIAIWWYLSMYVNPIINQTTQEFDQNRKIKFTQEKKIVNVKVWTLIFK